MKRLISISIVMALAMTAGCGNASYVKKGEIGLLINDFTGQIDQVLDPGYRLTMPFNKHIVEYPITDQQYVMVQAAGEGQTHGDDSVKVNSLEGQAYNVDASVEYRLSGKDAVPALYKKYGGKSFETLVEQYYRSKFRAEIINAFATMPLAEGITGSGRKKAEAIAQAAIQSDLKADQITVIAVLVRSVHVPDAIATSIQAKTNAQNELVQSRTKAEQQVVEAQAQAAAAVATAEGSAKARLIEATAEAKANNLISKSLTPTLVRMEYVKRLSDKIQIVLPEKSFFNFGGIVPAAPAAK